MMHEAGRIEQDVGLAGALGHCRHRGAVAGVELCDLGDAFLLEQCQLGLVDVGGEHGGALARKRQRAGAADADGGGSHEGALAFQAV